MTVRLVRLLNIKRGWKKEKHKKQQLFEWGKTETVYDTLPARVYISGTSVKKINFGCFNQKKYVLIFFSCFPSLIECLLGVKRHKKKFLGYQSFDKM